MAIISMVNKDLIIIIVLMIIIIITITTKITIITIIIKTTTIIITIIIMIIIIRPGNTDLISSQGSSHGETDPFQPWLAILLEMGSQ